MNAKYYQDYYIYERKHWWFVVRANILYNSLVKYTQKSDPEILNVGVATGASTEMLQNIGKVTSLEYDKDCCEFIKDKLKIDIINGSVLELPFQDSYFDIVTAYDVIEHVEDDFKAAEELVRVCKPGGLIHVTVPAYNFLWSEHDEINHHYRRYNLTRLKKTFDKQAVKYYYNTYFNSLLLAPITAMRFFGNLYNRLTKREENEVHSDFEKFHLDGVANKLFYKIFSFESSLLKMGISFPAGVSVQILMKKK